jgi:hypothetical protein
VNIRSLTLTAALLLAGCATPYQAPGFTGGVASRMITDDTALVVASGNAYTSATTIQMYVLRKAAETTLEAGKEWFLIVDARDQSRSGTMNFGGTAQSTTTYQGYGQFNTNTTYSPPTAINYIKPGEQVMIRMGSGSPPPGAMNAAQVARNLTPSAKPK